MTSNYTTRHNGTEHILSREDTSRLLAATARPFVIACDRELSVLRRGLTKEGWKRSLYLQDMPDDITTLSGTGLLARANYWLDAEIKIPDRGGRYDDYFCDDGNRLETPSQIPTNNGYKCPGCGRVYTGETYEAAARWFRHHALAAGCLTLALVFQIDRDQECAEKAVEILKNYAYAYPGAHTDEITGGMMYHSKDEAEWIIPLAQAYDLVYHCRFITPVDRDAIENKLLRQVALGLNEIDCKGASESWHLAAVGIIGCALKDAGLLNTAIAKFAGQIENELGDDGIWPESSHIQHFSALTAFVHLAEVCSRVGIDLYNYRPRRDKCIKSMFTAPLVYAYPSFQFPAIHNSPYFSNLPLPLYEIAFRRWGDPAFAWVLKTGYGYSRRPESDIHIKCRQDFTRSSLYAFLFGRDLPGRVQEPRLVSSDMKSIGICILRNEAGSMLTLDYGMALPYGRLDKMGITLFANKKALCADYGTPGDGSAAAGYYSGTAGHNTVVVDGKPQQRMAEVVLTEFRKGEYLQMAEAESKETYPGVTHNRQVVMAYDIAVIRDMLKSDVEHVYDWLLRCEGEMYGFPGNTVQKVDVCEQFRDALCLDNEADSIVLGWDDNGPGLRGMFVMDAPGTVIKAECPAETTSRTVPLLDLRRKGKTAGFISLLVPYTDDIPEITCCGKVMKAARGNTVDWIYVADAPHCNDGDTSELESDAEIAAVRVVDGKVTCCGLYGGSYVRLNGEPLIMAAGRFDKIEIRLDSRNPVVAFEGASGGYLRLKCHSRAMRVNGHRISAACTDGMATIRLVGVLAGA